MPRETPIAFRVPKAVVWAVIVAGLCGFFGSFAAVVWSAATISEKVSTTVTEVVKLKMKLDAVAEDVATIKGRLAPLRTSTVDMEPLRLTGPLGGRP